MPPTMIIESPSVDDYIPLEEYESQTPDSFVDGKPVLHYHVAGAKAWVPKTQRGKLAIFPMDSVDAPKGSEAKEVMCTAEIMLERKVDVFVNSENFTIFALEIPVGLSIPYPSISIHAVKDVCPEPDAPHIQAVWMQLEFADGGSNDDDFSTVELTIIPPTNAGSPSAVSKLFEALSSCSDLHPDPDDGDEDEEDDYDRIIFEGDVEHEAIEGFTGVMRGASDGGLPPPMPGSGGWITADNVHEYFDENGNWIRQGDEEQEDLGEGAGRVRPREEAEVDDGVNGHKTEGDPENKRPRVEE